MEKVLAALAFSQLESRLKDVPAYTLAQLSSLETPKPKFPESAALFVTWNIKQRLRGCIGTFSPLPLEEGIESYAITAAFEDPRFAPIKAKELEKLDVAVTLLGPLERIKDPLDWTIGLHGVKAIFKGGYSSTYLPEVAEEQGWDQEETLESLADKAGAPTLEGVKMYRYKGTKSKLTYSEYKKFVAPLDQ